MFFKKPIYLDNAATTKTRLEVVREISKYFKKIYGNPSSIHKTGFIARGSIELARERVANILNCGSNEIIFTGSGTESNNLAIRGVAKALKNKGKHIITSKIEHDSVLKTCEELEKEGFKVTYLNVDKSGIIDLEQLKKTITSKTILVSIMYSNNEIGTIESIEDIIEIVKSKNVLLHVDAVQAMPYIKIDLKKLNIDLLSISGHKLYAPKGVGILFVRENTKIAPIITGGDQEFGLRCGTENIPFIMGLSRALILNNKEKEKYISKLAKFRKKIIEEVKEKIPNNIVTSPINGSPSIASFCFKGVDGKLLVKELSQYNIEVSSGSACSSPKEKVSHILKACKIPKEYIKGSLRISLGRYNTEKEINYLLKILPKIIKKVREKKTEVQKIEAFISKEELKRKLMKNKDLQILDVRPAPFPGKKIKNSIYIPIWKLKKNIQKLDNKKETIVVCYQGDIISPEAYYILIKNDFKNVKILKGGLFNYDF